MTSRRDIVSIAAILFLALLFRIPVISWGLPSQIPHVKASDIRCSYAFDEDDLLTGISFTKPAELDLDPRLYQWGTLHLNLTLVWLEGAERIGYIGAPWREAYYHLHPGAFERVYTAGRSLSVVFALLSILLTFLIGTEVSSSETGLWAALLVALSPAHLLGSVQIRVDLTMVSLILLVAWLGLRAQKVYRLKLFLWAGVAAGLAVSAKYTAVFFVTPIAIAALWPHERPWRAAGAVVTGCALGFLAGQPYLLVRSTEMWKEMSHIFRVNSQVPNEFLVPVHLLFGTHTANGVRFLLGPIAAALALPGIYLLLRRQPPAGWLILSALSGGALSMIPLMWPMLRYQLPLLPLLAVPAAFAISRVPAPFRWAVAVLAVSFPLGGSLAQVEFMRTPHPANRALAKVLDVIPAGTPVSRMSAELPPLDRKLYPMGPNPFLDDISVDPPLWVLTSDLPDRDYPLAALKTLQGRYERIADFHSLRLFSWATLGESGAPHDWKYTHPRMVLYRRLP